MPYLCENKNKSKKKNKKWWKRVKCLVVKFRRRKKNGNNVNGINHHVLGIVKCKIYVLSERLLFEENLIIND